MSNSLGTLGTALILQEALTLVFKRFPMLSMVTRNLSAESVDFNQNVITRLKTVPTVTNFSADTTSDFTTTDVSVPLDKFKKIKVQFTATEMNSTNRNLIQEAAEPIAVAIGKNITDAVAALYTSGNYSNATTDATPTYETVNDLRAALAGRGIYGDRFLLANVATYTALLNDPLCNRQYKNGGADPTQTGELDTLLGFKYVREYADLPTTGNLTAFAGTPDSVCLASRAPRDPRMLAADAQFPGNWGVVTDPMTGLSVAYSESINPETWTVTSQVGFMYGVAVGNASAGQRLISA